MSGRCGRSWCQECQGHTSSGGYVEVFHDSARFELPLTRHWAVSRGEALPRRRQAEARVALSGYDGGQAGERLAPDLDVVVLDLPDDVASLTAEEARRLAGALLRAARQLGRQAAGECR